MHITHQCSTLKYAKLLRIGSKADDPNDKGKGKGPAKGKGKDFFSVMTRLSENTDDNMRGKSNSSCLNPY